MKRRRSTKRRPPDNATNQARHWLDGEEGLSQEPENVNLGKDNIFQILARLPIKVLLRLKVVSKCWYRLISGPEFINFRLQYACDDPDYTYHKFLRVDFESEEILRQAPLYPTLRDPADYSLETAVSHPIEFWEEELCYGSALTFVGSCRGLVCIAGLYHRVVIWNPALRMCKKLPYFGRGSEVVYGFGYDESSDDFKVVGIRCTTKRPVKSLVKIFSVRNNSWKTLEEDCYTSLNLVDGNGCFLNGKLHWASQDRFTGDKSIFTVDLTSEHFGVTDLPNCLRMVESHAWSVHAVGEFLSVFAFYKQNTPTSRRLTANLWMMERYGVRESWRRVNNDFGDCHPGPFDPINKERARSHAYSMYVAPCEPSESAWRMIRIPDHMSGIAIDAFLFYCIKHADYYFDDPRAFFKYYYTYVEPTTVYVESLVWPFPTITRA